MPRQNPPQPRLAQAAHGAARVASAHAEQAEIHRSLAPEVMAALVGAGFARHFVPAAHGGRAGQQTPGTDGGSFTALLPAVGALGAVCPSAAWCASIMAGLARMAAFLPEEGRKQLWQDGPDAVIVGSVSPKGRARHTEGGWLLSGEWPYVSAVSHSDWALVLGLVEQPDGGTERRMFALRRAVYRIERTWSDIGMRGTGSDSLVAEDVFVSTSLTFRAEDLMAGRAPGPAARCHTVPLPVVNGLFFTLPMLGAARGALAQWLALAEKRLHALGPGVPGPGRSLYEETLARSSGEIDAAELLLGRVTALADSGTDVTAKDAARCQRDCALAADLLVGAVERLFRSAGTAGHSEHSPLQRLWRDVHSAAGHVVLQFGPAAMAYAQQVLSPPAP
ncbi:hydrolase [Streptomyces sp. NPDC029526]|uniref:hydrolase n=1 Tax=Streptomyces sp. NPDC029526 TaxID=3155728 RepID=UPI0033DD8903